MKRSVGLAMVRLREPPEGKEVPEVLLAHPGGPFFAKKDDGAWTIPKGLLEPGEAPFEAARREFHEEIGFHPPSEPTAYVELGEVRQSRKIVQAWAFLLPRDADWTPADLRSNEFEMEWPPKSGRMASFPEVDRAAFFDRPTARQKCLGAQVPLIERALDALEILV